jgi:ADP-heptose:LPS heptosyltransferase
LRFLDETLAAVLLRILGTFRTSRQLPGRPGRIGVMKSTGIGDMVLATAVVRDIVERFPEAAVVIFAGADNAGVARLVEGAKVVEVPAAKPWAALPLIRAEKLDVMLDLGQWTRLEALYTALSGARWTAGFETPGQRRHHAYDATVPHSAAIPEIDNYRAAAETLGLSAGSLPRFEASGAAPSLAVPKPFVVFHLWPGGYRSELREWPQDRWRRLAEAAMERGVAVLLTGGPGDVERTGEFIASCGGESDRLASIAGKCGLAELIDILVLARCVVSVNTGVMHLAAAAGTWTIALNGPTNSRRWGPIGARTVNVDSELPGCGFLNLGFEYDGQRTDCMEGITVDRVESAMLRCIDD